MDIIQRKLLDVNSDCYMIRASVDAPFIYLRFRGRVVHRYTNGDMTSYHVQVHEILEDTNVIKQFMNRARFRTYAINTGRISNRVLYTYDIVDDINFQQTFRERYKNQHFDVHTSLVFETHDEMSEAYVKSLSYLTESLTSTLKILQERQRSTE